jgi:Mg/Co/Ni transporter MgtE
MLQRRGIGKEAKHGEEKISAYLEQMDNDDKEKTANEESAETVKSAIKKLKQRKRSGGKESCYPH